MVRHKNRYMIVQINPEEQTKDGSLSLNPTSIQNSVWKKLQQLHGDFGIAAVRPGFRATYCNEKTRIAIIKSRHGPHKLVGSTLPFINSIGGNKMNMNTLYVGATIRQCYKFLLCYQKKKLDELCATLKTNEEKAAVRKAMLNFDSIVDNM